MTIFKLIPAPMIKKYKLFKEQERLRGNRLVRWCPKQCGGFATPKKQLEQERLKCSCGADFCSLCSLPWHHPKPCLPVLLIHGNIDHYS
jgi:hypothetical protein